MRSVGGQWVVGSCASFVWRVVLSGSVTINECCDNATTLRALQYGGCMIPESAFEGVLAAVS